MVRQLADLEKQLSQVQEGASGKIDDLKSELETSQSKCTRLEAELNSALSNAKQATPNPDWNKNLNAGPDLCSHPNPRNAWLQTS